jgi:hypothetical protein
MLEFKFEKVVVELKQTTCHQANISQSNGETDILTAENQQVQEDIDENH